MVMEPEGRVRDQDDACCHHHEDGVAEVELLGVAEAPVQ